MNFRVSGHSSHKIRLSVCWHSQYQSLKVNFCSGIASFHFPYVAITNHHHTTLPPIFLLHRSLAYSSVHVNIPNIPNIHASPSLTQFSSSKSEGGDLSSPSLVSHPSFISFRNRTYLDHFPLGNLVSIYPSCATILLSKTYSRSLWLSDPALSNGLTLVNPSTPI